MEVKPRSTVRRAAKRPSAGAHIAIGANRPHAGELTLHPIEAQRTAIAVVVPTEIPRNTSKGRQGISGAPLQLNSDFFPTTLQLENTFR